MDANSIIADWKRRLIAMAEDPPYVFHDTPQELIAAHHRRLTTFVGYSEEEVAGAEGQLGVRFPVVFRAYLREMGRSPGDLFRGSDLADIAGFDRLRDAALALMAETDPGLTLPPDAVVFLFHQGYAFLYLRAAGGFDSPVWQYAETESEPEEAAPSFADMVGAELRLMESNQATARERGGYYVTLYPDGGAAQSYPALNSGDRPLDHPRLESN
jgi:hypothetical protein